MQYPVDMYRVKEGKVIKLRFKQDAPVNKPGWFMNLADAEKSLIPKPIEGGLPEVKPESKKPSTLFRKRKISP